mmetsp:Transcript_66826/g.148068  ORF Transcript_66826/g.148068 Transcript_66826/m.148068 type:complete len:212 (+) Transcript_66826:191-826(+)
MRQLRLGEDGIGVLPWPGPRHPHHQDFTSRHHLPPCRRRLGHCATSASPWLPLTSVLSGDTQDAMPLHGNCGRLRQHPSCRTAGNSTSVPVSAPAVTLGRRMTSTMSARFLEIAIGKTAPAVRATSGGGNCPRGSERRSPLRAPLASLLASRLLGPRSSGGLALSVAASSPAVPVQSCGATPRVEPRPRSTVVLPLQIREQDEAWLHPQGS